MKLDRLHLLLKSTKRDFTLSDFKVVIDAQTYFPAAYSRSGCSYILGGEYDRFADYLKKQLNCFQQANVTCYVIFNGSMKADIGKRLELHQKVIDQRNSLSPVNKNNVYAEPAFLKDLFKQVLDELGIPYMVCEYDSFEELINTAKYFHCPLITKNVEYSLFGVPCIPPKSLLYEPESKCFSAKIYNPEDTRARINYPPDKLSVFLVLLDENNVFLKRLQSLIRFPDHKELNGTLRWLRSHTLSVILSDISKNMEKHLYDDFNKQYNHVRDVKHRCNTKLRGVNYFQELPLQVQGRSAWFSEGVACGWIPIIYVGLMENRFSGSWLVFDEDKEDAMLPSMEIVSFASQLMSDFAKTPITLIGRTGTSSSAITIDPKSFQSHNFTYTPKWKKHVRYWEHIPDYFAMFVESSLPGLNWSLLATVPDTCTLLLLSLVYYTFRMNRQFVAGAYSVLLSYVMLGPVTQATGLVKRSNFLLSRSTGGSASSDANDVQNKDCHSAATTLMDYFYTDDKTLKSIYDRKVLHMFGEFQHCLQQMNYLNKFCGEHAQGTVYHQTYNAVLVYNVYLKIHKDEFPLRSIEGLLAQSPSVLKFFKKIVNVFEEIGASLNC